MALTYAALKSIVTDWALPGGEPNFNLQLTNFIQMAEARFNRELRTMNMIGVSDMTTDKAFPGVPPDWLETIAISVKDGRPLEHLTINQRQAAFYPAGIPWGYCNVDGGYRLVPSPSAERTYEVTYYRSLEALSDVNPLNWLLFTAPDAYISCTLSYAHSYLENDEAMQKYTALATDAIQKMNEQSKNQEFSRGQPLTRAISFG